jgi:hypothetical protein
MDDGFPIAVDVDTGRIAPAPGVAGGQQAFLRHALPHRALVHQESDALLARRPLRYRERDAGCE